MSPGYYSATSSAGVALSDGSGSFADLDCCPAESADTPMSPETLAFLFREFSDTTQKLQESHSTLEERVALLRAELNEKSHMLERKKRPEGLGLMVAGVAHEIRNPLGSLSLYIDCLREEIAQESTSTDECQSLVKRIEEAIAHLDSVVQNMLDFACLEGVTGSVVGSLAPGKNVEKVEAFTGVPLKVAEEILIKEALRRNGGHQKRTAVELGIGVLALRSKIRKWDLRDQVGGETQAVENFEDCEGLEDEMLAVGGRRQRAERES